jgi:hypothetical protein
MAKANLRLSQKRDLYSDVMARILAVPKTGNVFPLSQQNGERTPLGAGAPRLSREVQRPGILALFNRSGRAT